MVCIKLDRVVASRSLSSESDASDTGLRMARHVGLDSALGIKYFILVGISP